MHSQTSQLQQNTMHILCSYEFNDGSILQLQRIIRFKPTDEQFHIGAIETILVGRISLNKINDNPASICTDYVQYTYIIRLEPKHSNNSCHITIFAGTDTK
eukprot:54135_1